MAKKDDSNSDISIAGRVAGWDASLRIKSRLVAAWDRLVGNRIDKQSLPLEREAAIKRAKAEQEVAIIRALGKRAIAKLAEDEELAERAMLQHFGAVLAAQRNVEAVVSGAADQLLLSPPKADMDSGPETISEEFSARLEGYARSASTSELREKWAGVLAAEIRIPGTISNKVMRIIDEIPQETASLFNHFCNDCIGNFVPMHLSGDIGYEKRKLLFRSELIDDANLLGPVVNFHENTDSNGLKIWALELGNFSIAIKRDDNIRQHLQKDNFIVWGDSGPAIRVYALTEAGQTVASIVNRDELNAACRFAEAFNKTHSLALARVFKKNSQGLYASI